ncbi:MAG: DUF86 domain-containing protein, partial [Desulfobacteraceae bacterium]|nr:DUF86 domain-containing protein [Desulfobacteraceae bacterium]
SAKAVQSFVDDISYDEYIHDRKMQLAVERSLEIIGEAARKISEPLKTSHPEIPWKSIVGLRNVLAHEYGEILQERIWSVATQRIPELVSALNYSFPEVRD